MCQLKGRFKIKNTKPVLTPVIVVGACEYCATCDLHEQNVKTMASCVQINRDCANICWTASQFMSRDSEYVKQICNVCADICEACAKECERYTDMDHCQKCAQACRRCAKECRKM